MKVTGGATLHAPAATVWAALTDPAVLVQAIPGCERLTATAEDTYALTVTAGVGTITGTYTGQITLADQRPPAALTLRASGAGSPGTVETTVLVRLADNSNETVLRYDADAMVGGVIAGVGQRMLAAAAKRQATQFFTALDELLLVQAEAGAAAAPPGEAAETAAAETAAAETAAAETAAAGGGSPPGPGEAGAARRAGAAGPAAGTAEPGEGRRAAGAAGVSSPGEPATRGASARTWERPTAAGQPAGLRVAGPPNASFLQGAAVGAVIALAGVVVGSLISRRKH